MTVIAKCSHDQTKYCNNWDGKGKEDNLQEGGVFSGNCPSDRAKCKFKVTPKPSSEVKAK